MRLGYARCQAPGFEPSLRPFVTFERVAAQKVASSQSALILAIDRARKHTDYVTDMQTCVTSLTNQIYELKNGSGIQKKGAVTLTSVSERL